VELVSTPDFRGVIVGADRSGRGFKYLVVFENPPAEPARAYSPEALQTVKAAAILDPIVRDYWAGRNAGRLAPATGQTSTRGEPDRGGRG
jgi:hypothetical protein